MSTPASLAVQRRRFRVAAPGVVALCLLFAVLLSDVFTMPQRQTASGVGLLVAGLLAAISCGQRARQTEGKRRRTWRLFMGAAVVAVVGNVWVAASGADPVENPSFVGEASIALALLLSIAGLLNFPGIRRRGIDLLVMSLDGVVAAGAVLIMSTLLVYSRLLDAATSSADALTTTLLFPLLDIVLVTVAVLLILRGRGPDRPVLALVAGGFVMYAIGDLAFAVLAEQGRFEFGTPLDLGWIAGYLIIGLAAWYPSDLSDAPAQAADGGASDARGTLVVFSVLLLAAVVQVAFGAEGRLEGAQAVLWLVLILAAGARQALLASDNAALRRGLERRVSDQTADLRRLARQTEVLLSSVGDGIYGVDHEGRVTFINPSGARALGYEPHDLHGRSAHDRFHAPDADGRPFPWEGCYVADAIREGMLATAEADVYVRADGTTFPVEITASPVVDEDRLQRRRRGVPRRDPAPRGRPDEGRVPLGRQPRAAHPADLDPRLPRPARGRDARRRCPARGLGWSTIALQSTERLIRLINDILDIERIESGTRPMEVDRPRRRPAAGRGGAADRRPRRRRSACASRSAHGRGRVLADADRHHADADQPARQRHQVLRARAAPSCSDATEGDGARAFRVARPGPRHPGGQARDASSSASSRSTPPTPARRAAPASGSRSAAASSSSTAAGSGRRASWAWGRPCSSRSRRSGGARHPSSEADRATVAPLREIEAQILLVEDDEDLAGVIVALMGDHGLEVVHATSAADAVALARSSGWRPSSSTSTSPTSTGPGWCASYAATATSRTCRW